MEKTLYCLVLKLDGGKYWVAETRNPGEYLCHILEGEGPKWVRAHGFVEAEAPVQVDSSLEIFNEIVKEHGIDSVRGTICPRRTVSKRVGMKLGLTKRRELYVFSLGEDKYYVTTAASDERDKLSSIPHYWRYLACDPYDEPTTREVCKIRSPLDVDRKVEELMFKHGMDGVRGGSYDTRILEEYQYRSLERKFEYAREETK